MLLKFAIKDFIEDRDFRNLSKETVVTYKFTLGKFHDYCTENEIVDVSDITASTIKSFLIHCKNVDGNNPTTLNSMLRRLRTFFNYLVSNEIISEKSNPAIKVQFAKEDIKIEVFSPHQVNQMIAYFQRAKYRDKAFVAYRDYMLVVFLLATGVRLGELANLKWSDVDMDNRVITVFGKLREQRSVPFTNKLKKELIEYNLFLQQYFDELGEHVFTNGYNQPLTENAIKCIFKRLKKVMNFKNVRLSAHTFRHTFAHRCLMNGMDVFTLQKLMGHKDLRMTERYLALWGTALKEQNDKFNPLNDLDL